ncbi:MAG: putative monovalent cation/H+ antiporter subunit A [Rhizobiaceae bacterium]|nr:putative monovalent cation/H+ antiporter subunit A [Rhizobiaceae bacterium]
MTGQDPAPLFPEFGFFALALPFLAAALAPILSRAVGRRAPVMLALFPAFAFGLLLLDAASVRDGAAVLWGFDWVPAYDIRFSLRLDGLSFVFGLLITGIGTLVVLYSGGYLGGHRDTGRFLAFILMFMGSMLGLVLADDLMTLILFWELTSITSFLLIGFDHERESARRAAILELVITGGGGLALMAGLVLLRELFGLASLTEVLAAGDTVRASDWYLPILGLVLLGAFTKSAQMPFHVWLPNAMEAPTPVSAYLHSATMVKAGVYLLMRLDPALGGTGIWETVLPLFGGATLLGGALLALRQTDLKLVLAYTTVASLGLLVMLIGIGSDVGMEAAVLYLVAHSLFKGGLFMVAGSIDHGAGTRDLRALGGLRKAMPITFAAAMLSVLSMAGVTPFFGFLAKEEIYHATVTGDLRGLLLTIVAICGNAAMVAAALLVAVKPFFGAPRVGLAKAHEGSVLLWIGPVTLAVAGLAAGLFSGGAHALLSDPMASAIAQAPAGIAISALPYFNLSFALSLVTIALGVLLYLAASSVRGAIAATLDRIGWGPDRGFDQAMHGLIRGAVRVTGLLQTGRLDHYVTVTFLVIGASVLVGTIAADALPAAPAFPAMSLTEWIVTATLLAGLFAIVFAKNRLTAVVSIGIQGLSVALLFILLGAPDLGFTQLMVETLSVVILALVMTRLKLDVADHRARAETLLDAAIAALCAIALGVLLLSITQMPFDATLSDFFARYSYSIAHGRNIVNVILVDFRGIDTMGEIAVVMTAGLAILALVRIRARPKGRRRADPTEATP